MKVYVLIWRQSYDGPVYEGVFATRREALVAAEGEEVGDELHPNSAYEILEEDVL